MLEHLYLAANDLAAFSHYAAANDLAAFSHYAAANDLAACVWGSPPEVLPTLAYPERRRQRFGNQARYILEKSPVRGQMGLDGQRGRFARWIKGKD